MDIFNKKQIKNLEQKIQFLQQKIDYKDKQIADLVNKNKLLEDSLTQFAKSPCEALLVQQNQKLVNWIQEIMNASNIMKVDNPDAIITIPIYNCEYKLTDDERNSKYLTPKKEIIVPTIHFTIR